MPDKVTVTAAWAKAHLPELLNEVEKGETIVISRYKKPVAVISPVEEPKKPRPKFGTGKGKVKLIDPHAFDPMTDEEVDALLEGRY
ncbi:type II toxin-antitoxin system Phd/YefM family antitoxin [Paracidobacterium acidisoli]|uniref:Antitoxin n=1 Tax=Paracidobacterium acidisoli TaxID=2303751 RepID=A0A372ISY2_9BACT|nr:type II toxin-antitoxin system prevent-host-death family antitoxin [Paracidobacterium acidisoli]MBT9329438.1 type II toxin-antitoxin system prevent-host-death family antitoxin [Paracidobacterium acidisoli]